MLDGLSGREEADVQRRSLLVFLHDLRAFIGNPVDRLAGLSLGLLADNFENLIEPQSAFSIFRPAVSETVM